MVCLQELKAEQQAFPATALRDLGYSAVWQGERSWNGVAILARDSEPVLTRSSLPGDPDDHQARYIEAAVNGVLVASIYLPNGNPQPGPKFDYKLAWFERLHRPRRADSSPPGCPWCWPAITTSCRRAGHLSHALSRQQRARFNRKAAQAFARLLAQGWTDALRTLAARRAALDVLGLRARPLGVRQGHAARSLPALSSHSPSPGGRRRGPLGPRRGKRERPRAGLD